MEEALKDIQSKLSTSNIMQEVFMPFAERLVLNKLPFIFLTLRLQLQSGYGC